MSAKVDLLALIHLNYEKLLLVRLHGSFDPSSRHQQQTIGFNFRMTDLHSSLGLSVLPTLSHRQFSISESSQLLQELLTPLSDYIQPCLSSNSLSPSIYNEYFAVNSSELLSYLNSNNLNKASIPLYSYIKNNHKAYVLFLLKLILIILMCGICLPSGPDLTLASVRHTANLISSFYSI